MIAQVAFPIAIPGIYDYRIPDEFKTRIVSGIPVKVSLKTRVLWGVVVAITDKSKWAELKDVIDVKSEAWAQSSKSLFELYQWVASYYQSDLGKVFKPLIKKSFADMKAKKISYYSFSNYITSGLTKKQKEVVERLKNMPNPVSRKILQDEFCISNHMVSILIEKGILKKSEKQVLREADELTLENKYESIVLSEEQTHVAETIWNTSFEERKPFLLYGITGSGKTLVYIDLVKRTLANGKSVIILVPEISLTPQTIKRFQDAIGSNIAVIHSRMSGGERRDSVEELVSGRKRVVIGVRSAILVPMNNVGLIIVDEEHDGSYKQSDPEPRYNARDVAVMRGHFQKALVVLGSATPSFETYYNAITGKYIQVSLLKRYGEATLPQVEIIDMNLEHKNNNWTFMSEYLKEKIEETIENKKQIILLLNRRGFSVSLICKDCGHIYECPNCSVNLIYHTHGEGLKCHQCGYGEPAPANCVSCGGEQIKYKGTGIQKAEEYIQELFPQVRIMRMDQDTTRRKGAHVSILQSFAKYEADILLGTQMVAKGLNFPGVRLVGVLQADIGLHFPDFRASERTFQLLAQVAGRAGRKDSHGIVVVQTYSPQERSICAAKKHDYPGYFKNEIETRKELDYPPFSRLARILVKGSAEAMVKAMIFKIAQYIKRQNDNSVTVIGPSPAAITRLKNVFRYSMILKSHSPKRLQKMLFSIRHSPDLFSKTERIVIDVDPVNML